MTAYHAAKAAMEDVGDELLGQVETAQEVLDVLESRCLSPTDDDDQHGGPVDSKPTASHKRRRSSEDDPEEQGIAMRSDFQLTIPSDDSDSGSDDGPLSRAHHHRFDDLEFPDLHQGALDSGGYVGGGYDGGGYGGQDNGWDDFNNDLPSLRTVSSRRSQRGGRRESARSRESGRGPSQASHGTSRGPSANPDESLDRGSRQTSPDVKVEQADPPERKPPLNAPRHPRKYIFRKGGVADGMPMPFAFVANSAADDAEQRSRLRELKRQATVRAIRCAGCPL